jgi:hypothetical protein
MFLTVELTEFGCIATIAGSKSALIRNICFQSNKRITFKPNSWFKFLLLLRTILLFANIDVSTTKMCLFKSILAKSIMGWRK